MSLLSGLNHVAVMTRDLDRFVAFYREVFELDVVFSETTPAFRHAILRTGPTSWLHPAEIADNAHATGSPAMFDRGHVDHVALTAACADDFETLRQRLIGRGASSGKVDDLGAFHSVWFEDPDGMRGEVVVIVHPDLAGIHAPTPLDD